MERTAGCLISDSVRWQAPYRQFTDESVQGIHHSLSGLDINPLFSYNFRFVLSVELTPSEA
ncbi:MAG: hypothetical protein ACFCBU_14160 [Cyanophyceae cyanobacterium]